MFVKLPIVFFFYLFSQGVDIIVFAFKIIFRRKVRNNVTVLIMKIIFRRKLRDTITVFT